jgi:hypothetical protein
MKWGTMDSSSPMSLTIRWLLFTVRLGSGTSSRTTSHE